MIVNLEVLGHNELDKQFQNVDGVPSIGDTVILQEEPFHTCKVMKVYYCYEHVNGSSKLTVDVILMIIPAKDWRNA